MPNQARPRPTRKKQPHQARIVPSMLDEMEAMVRHPDFQRALLLWRTIFSKNYVGLTEEEEIERDAPRTHIRVAAIMEADEQWLSRSIQDIRARGEDVWAFDAVNGPFGDRTDTVNPHIPADLSLDAMQQCVAQFVRQARKTSGVTPMQHPRVPGIDPWNVYDLKQEKGLNLLAITHRLFKTSGSPAYDENVAARYAQVRRAYSHARAALMALDQPTS
ncbi:MAG: hypothetical protein E8D46_10180 [Nitrospira sp.]|nr:MAG: hypothetical protein E8D46_10180 [Nitrospira sp.]